MEKQHLDKILSGCCFSFRIRCIFSDDRFDVSSILYHIVGNDNYISMSQRLKTVPYCVSALIGGKRFGGDNPKTVTFMVSRIIGK